MPGDHADASEETLLSDEEIIQHMNSDPKVQARIQEALERIRTGGAPSEPGISAEELASFLREHG